LGKEMAKMFTQTAIFRTLGKEMAKMFTQTAVFRTLGKESPRKLYPKEHFSKFG
jgi:hypothetical protein